jgi:FKBP-type peptidyl-prolyl cis-trans isomerase SlyD
MKIARDSVVSIDYTLTDDKGEVLDSSKGQKPLDYLHGHGQIVPGLERELEGKQLGDSFKVDVAPKDGYGEHNPRRIVQVPRTELPSDLAPEIGMQLAAEGPDGEVVPLWITAVTDSQVTLDGNHPLAGQTLHFAIDIRGVREATKEELTHGHVHGPGHEH